MPNANYSMAKRKFFKTDEPGSLKKHGYSPKKSETVRHRALKDAINESGNDALEVFQKLHGLANVSRSTQPQNSSIYRWIQSGLAICSWGFRCLIK